MWVFTLGGTIPDELTPVWVELTENPIPVLIKEDTLVVRSGMGLRRWVLVERTLIYFNSFPEWTFDHRG
jgi:hypothetical protein